MLTLAEPSRAHEVLPAIADMTETNGTLTFSVDLNLEGFIAGVDLASTSDTNQSPQAAQYDALHAESPAGLEARFRTFWPGMANGIRIVADGAALTPELTSVTIPEVGDPELPRTSTIVFTATLPAGTKSVQVGWSAPYGALVLRQMGVDAPYDGLLNNGALSEPIALSGGNQKGPWETFFDYIPTGFDHIVPKGLDHILFVLGLFFLSTQLAPLLWQITAFTLAHTITLAAAALGYITVPGSIVEPIIAASIVYVAVENIFANGVSRWRPYVVFVFGLLHGLGFASVLAEFGLPDNAFVPALIGFNIGVELGQLAVIATAFALVGFWFRGKPWYRTAIAIPASAAIACVGAYWFVERVFL